MLGFRICRGRRRDWLRRCRPARCRRAGAAGVRDLLYLDRYWFEEQQVCSDVLTLVSSRLPAR